MSYGFKDYAYDVLKKTDHPLNSKDIWDKGVSLGLDAKLGSKGKTPWQSLSAQLYLDIRDNTDSNFVQISKRPALFWLKEKTPIKEQEIARVQKKEDQTEKEINYKERDLHPVLVKYVYGNSHFSCFTKTIYHEVGKKTIKNADKWSYPDLIGIYFPFHDYNELTLSTLEIFNEKSYKVFSFEMKKSIYLSNLREYYFQAVSNSSWANEGYLVAPEISDDEDFLSEVSLLNSAFGIGVIKLNIQFPEQSEILFYAKPHVNLDINMLDKLIVKNSNVKQIFTTVRESSQLARIVNKELFDRVLEDEEYSRFIKEKLQ
ncbi:MAG: HrgA protein [Oscillospiraceae bacterium]|nr:HrgA protein [Oscillospiraceae bacterium]